MTQEIGVGLVGYGLGGRAFHAPYIGITPGMTLRAVVSGDAAKVQRDLPGMRVVPSIEDLLDLPSIDLVVISSPDALHAPHASAAIAAGKHVVIDKPFATTLSDARRVAAEAAAQQRIATVFHNRRWDADFRTLRHLIETGMLGDIISLESRFDRWRPVAADIWKEARDGGAWMDLGPHLVDQALVLFGRPVAVTADIATMRDGAPAPDYFHAVLRYSRHRVILHSSKLSAAHDLRFMVHGNAGSWIKHGVDPQEAATVAGAVPGGQDWGVDRTDGILTRAGDDGLSSAPFPNERGDYRLFWQGLAAAIRDGAPNPVPIDGAIAVMEVLDAGLRSSAERREIPL